MEDDLELPILHHYLPSAGIKGGTTMPGLTLCWGWNPGHPTSRLAQSLAHLLTSVFPFEKQKQCLLPSRVAVRTECR